MNSPPWIYEYSLVSDVEGHIDSMLIVSHSDQKDSIKRGHQTIIDTFNATDRAIIKIVDDIPDPGKNDRGLQSQQPSYSDPFASADHEMDNDEETVRTLDLDQSFEEDDYETTRYIIENYSDISIKTLKETWRQELSETTRGGQDPKYRKWIQDPVICLQKFIPDASNPLAIKETTLVYSIYHARLMDFLVAMQLAKDTQLNIRCHPSDLILEGGNMLYVDNILFVGRDLIKKNIIAFRNREQLRYGEARTNWDDQTIINLFREQFNVQAVVSLGTEHEKPSYDTNGLGRDDELEHKWSFQPMFHLDLFLNFGGKDPDTGKRIAFLGNPTMALDHFKGVQQLNHPESGRKIRGATQSLDSLISSQESSFFDVIRKQLQDEGLIVVDIPLYIYGSSILKGYVYCSWNNSIVEITKGGAEKRIYIPSYVEKDPNGKKSVCLSGHNDAIESVQNEVIRIYESYNFKVQLIDAGKLFRSSVQQSGSLRCMVKVLRRGSN